MHFEGVTLGSQILCFLKTSDISSIPSKAAFEDQVRHMDATKLSHVSEFIHCAPVTVKFVFFNRQLWRTHRAKQQLNTLINVSLGFEVTRIADDTDVNQTKDPNADKIDWRKDFAMQG